jgi:hypothetical protein
VIEFWGVIPKPFVMGVTNLSKLLRATSTDLHTHTSYSNSWLGTLPQFILHCFKFGTADIAEFAQWILALACARPNLLGSKVGFRIRADDVAE